MDRKERNTTPRPCSNDIILVDRDSLRKMLHLWISKYMDIEESKIEAHSTTDKEETIFYLSSGENTIDVVFTGQFAGNPAN